MHCHFYWLTISFNSHYITMSFLKGKGIVLLLQIKKLFTDNYYCLWSTSWVLDLFIHHLWCMKHQQSSTFIARADQIRSVAQSCPTLRPHEPQHTRPPCPTGVGKQTWAVFLLVHNLSFLSQDGWFRASSSHKKYCTWKVLLLFCGEISF